MQNSRFFGSSAGDTRQYNQIEFAEVLERFLTNGIIPGEGNELAVTQTDPARLAIKIADGMGWINGYFYKNDSDLEIDLEPADASNPRIDLVVLRLDVISSRLIVGAVKTGTPSASPIPPTVTQDTQIWEIALAEVLVPANATSITDSDITPADPGLAIPRNAEFGARRSATVIVAANDSSADSKVQADFVVPDNSGDAEDTIQAAIDSLPGIGGRVLLLEGTFIISGNIDLTGVNITLEGQGDSTLISIANGVPIGMNMISSPGGGGNIEIKNLRLNGNKANNPSGIHRGIRLTSIHTGVINGVTVQNMNEDAIYLDGCQFFNVTDNNIINNDDNGILLTASLYNVISQNSIRGNSTGVLVTNSSNQNNICDNIIEGSFSRGVSVQVASSNNSIQGNVIRKGSASPFAGVQISDGTGNFVTNNDLYNSGTIEIADTGTLTNLHPGNNTANRTDNANARASRNTAQSIPNAAFERIHFNAVNWDTNSFFNLGADDSIITINRGGLYNITGMCGLDSNATGNRILRLVRIAPSALDIAFVSMNAVDGTDSRLNISIIHRFDAGETFAFQVFQNSGGALNTDVASYATFLSIARIAD